MITIYFLGVSVFVVSANDEVDEILFPNAQTRLPPDHTMQGTSVRHADHSKVNKHFAGAIVLDRQDEIVDRQPLIGREITFPSGSPTRIDGQFRDGFPSLRDATRNRPIDLLSQDDRKTTRVATRIKLRGGNPLTAMVPSQGFMFKMPVLSEQQPLAERFYATVAKWTTSDATLELKTSKKNMWGAGPDKTIQLDAATRPVAYLFNFDVRDPDLDDFNEDPNACNGPKTDHDFKWIFQLMDPRAPRSRPWQDYLSGDSFPAPMTDCVPHALRPDQLLVPVSTCFPTVWDGP